MFEDRKIICKECGQEFIFTAGEQEFYAEKGLKNEPQRCRECRIVKKKERRERIREMHEAVCADCGKTTEIPFEPTEGRPVYCDECFRAHRASQD